jgi:PPM family protein phosphatase
VASAAVPLAEGDRLLLCSDGVSEYLADEEVGALISTQVSPARAARALVETALERGGQDNATAVVIKVVEVAGGPIGPEARQREAAALDRCALLAGLSPARRLRLLAAATRHDVADGEALPARVLGEPVAWILIEGAAFRAGELVGRGSLLYPETLAGAPASPGEWSARGPVRALALAVADVAALSAVDPELGEKIYGALAAAAHGRS